MAGWFPMDLDLQDKPEFLCIQATLDIDPDLLVGKLWKFWAWFDEQTTDGVMPRVSEKIIDARIGVKGFAAAMTEAGWLVVDESGVRIPGFEKRHSNSAKQRLSHARRQASYRKCAEPQRDGGTGPAREQHADGTGPAPTKPNQTKPTTTPVGPASVAGQKAAEAAEAEIFVKALPAEWQDAVQAVRSLKANRGNWAIQTAVQLGYQPDRVIEVVDFGKRHAKSFKSVAGAIINRLTTVGPEVPADAEWAAEIVPVPKPKPAMDPEVVRSLAIDRLVAERGMTRIEAATIVDSQALTA